MKKILVTGSSGFLGSAVVEYLKATGFHVSIVRRSPTEGVLDSVIPHLISKVNADIDWSPCVAGQDVIVHCAGRVHIFFENRINSLSIFRESNVELTLSLARCAALAKVKRFIFISSIGVNGDDSGSTPFNEESISNPHSSYSQSKYEAELGLWSISKKTNMEVVIIRPPVIYGPNAPGNFRLLINAINLGIPLPLGEANNHRSMISLENIVNFIGICITNPNAANQLFLVSDGKDISIKEIVALISEALGKKTCIVDVPQKITKFFLRAVGLGKVCKSLYGNLEIDISKAKRLLNWHPIENTSNKFKNLTNHKKIK